MASMELDTVLSAELDTVLSVVQVVLSAAPLIFLVVAYRNYRKEKDK